MTPYEITAAREIIEAATSGPWEVVAPVLDEDADRYTKLQTEYPYIKTNGGEDVPYEYEWDMFGILRANAEFIAAARTGWPKALDEVERLQSLEKIEKSKSCDHKQLDNQMCPHCGEIAPPREII